MYEFLTALNTFMTTNPIGMAFALTAFSFVALMEVYCHYAGYRDLFRWVRHLQQRAEKADRARRSGEQT